MQEQTVDNRIDLQKFIEGLEDQLPKDIAAHNQHFDRESRLTLYWCAIKILRLAQPQSRNFDDIDRENAESLRQRGYSMQEIAFVLGRSKSSVCQYLNEEE